MTPGHRFWPRMFVLAALFNFVFGLPIMLAPRWSHALAYLAPLPSAGSLGLEFWRDFGFCVNLIGLGYYFVSRDVTRNRGIVWLGIPAKLFDVTVLTARVLGGTARPLVLVPAAIDGGFALLFAVFLFVTRARPPAGDALR